MTTFTIPGQPYAKKRPRFSRKSGRAFDPASNGIAEDAVRAIALQHFRQPLVGPVKIKIMAQFEPPKSLSQKKRHERIGTAHTQRPDLDNLAKWICDGLNRIAFADDSQIADMHVQKIWGPTPQTVVIVSQEGMK